MRLVHIVEEKQQFAAHGLISEVDVDRLAIGSKGVFISENAGPVKLQMVVAQIGLGNGAGREMTYISSKNNEPIKMDQADDGEMRSSAAIYPVLFSAEKTQFKGWMHEQCGTIVTTARAQSLMGRFFRHSVSVLLRGVVF